MTLVRCAASDVGNVRGEQVCMYACAYMHSQKNWDRLGMRERGGMSEGETDVFYMLLTNYYFTPYTCSFKYL